MTRNMNICVTLVGI